MFIHGDELLQDASHLFSTTSYSPHVRFRNMQKILTYNPSSIRAFIGGSHRPYSFLFLCLCLATGNQGAELHFREIQAASEEMIRAYSKVPRHAQVVDRIYNR